MMTDMISFIPVMASAIGDDVLARLEREIDLAEARLARDDGAG